MKRLAEAATVVQVQREAVVAEKPERLVMMAVHVAGEEVKHSHVHEVEQSATLVVGRDLSHERAVVGICGVSHSLVGEETYREEVYSPCSH